MEGKSLVAVVGASGKTGSLTVQKLLDSNYKVRAIVRDPAKAQSWESKGVEVVKGDLTSQESLVNALKGVAHVVNAAAGFSFFGTGALTGSKATPYWVDYEGMKNLINACKAQPKPPSVVLVSSIGVTRPWSGFMLVLTIMIGKILHWKLAGEDELRKSGLRYTIIRPGGLVDRDEIKKKSLVVDQGDKISGRVAREAVAATVVASLTNPKAENTTFELVTGPNDAEGPTDYNALFSTLKRDS